MKREATENYVLVDITTPDDAPDVYLMIRDGHIASIQEYVSTQLNFLVDAVIYENKTMLHYACMFGFANIVQYLINDLKANINTISISEGKTALHLACQHGTIEIVRFLIHQDQLNIGTNRIMDGRYYILQLVEVISGLFNCYLTITRTTRQCYWKPNSTMDGLPCILQPAMVRTISYGIYLM